MAKIIHFAEKIIPLIDLVSEWSGRISSFGILVIVGAVTFEVVARYFFSSPTDWAFEIVTMVYGSYCVLVGAYTHLHDGHVRMDAVYNSLPKPIQVKLDFITGLLGLAFLVLFLLTAVKFAAFSWKIREFSSATTWVIPFYPFKTILAVGVLLLLLQQIATLLRNLSMMRKKKDVPMKSSINEKGGNLDGSN